MNFKLSNIPGNSVYIKQFILNCFELVELDEEPTVSPEEVLISPTAYPEKTSTTSATTTVTIPTKTTIPKRFDNPEPASPNLPTNDAVNPLTKLPGPLGTSPNQKADLGNDPNQEKNHSKPSSTYSSNESSTGPKSDSSTLQHQTDRSGNRTRGAHGEFEEKLASLLEPSKRQKALT